MVSKWLNRLMMRVVSMQGIPSGTGPRLKVAGGSVEWARLPLRRGVMRPSVRGGAYAGRTRSLPWAYPVTKDGAGTGNSAGLPVPSRFRGVRRAYPGGCLH